MDSAKLQQARVPVLPDGTTIDDLIDVERRRVSARVHTDPAVFELEQRAVFGRCWVAVAHVTEIPGPGDFVTRDMVGDRVIVVRERGGEVAVLLNVCAHRGMAVCRAERGTARQFRCPFHGWTYGLGGELAGVPSERRLYGSPRERGPLGLRHARVGVRAGMVFACWDPSAPELDEYLGDMGWYLDVGFARTKGGMEVTGPPQRWIFEGPWKMGSEQFAGDAYHAESLHKFAFDLGYMGKSRLSATGMDVMNENGHSLRLLDKRALRGDAGVDEFVGEHLPLGMSPELVDEARSVLSPEQFEAMVVTPPLVGNVFPNLSFIQNPMADAAGRTGGGAAAFMVWNPIAPGRMEILSWTLVERDAPEEVKRQMAATTVQTFSVSGTFEQDDAEAWSSSMEVLRGPVARHNWLDYASRVTGTRIDALPGAAYDGPNSDEPPWNFWLGWRAALMAGRS
jgi:nitrite reductase/ring-hydroxylating ferredoxin subunit